MFPTALLISRLESAWLIVVVDVLVEDPVEAHDAPVHNVYFVKYDVTVSFMAQVLDTVTYFVSHVLDSGYSDIFWHIL